MLRGGPGTNAWCRGTGVQGCRCAGVHVCRSACEQGYRCAGMQV